MLSKDLKEQLDLRDIALVLEELGCENIFIHSDEYITCSRPGGDNPQGVVVWDNHKAFNVTMYTDPGFEAYPIKDIMAFVQHHADLSFPASVNYVASILGFTDEDIPKKKTTALDWLNKFEHKCGTQGRACETYPEEELERYTNWLHPSWEEEGIDPAVAREYEIMFDPRTAGIVIPIRNSYGELAGVKMRNTSKSSRAKFWFPCPVKKNSILYGYYRNYGSIIEAGEVVVFESEKSVLKASSVGIDNTVALGGKTISDHQAELIIRMGVDVVLALDSDVENEEILGVANTINFPVKFTNIYTINNELLDIGEKDCIADNLDELKKYKDFKERVS